MATGSCYDMESRLNDLDKRLVESNWKGLNADLLLSDMELCDGAVVFDSLAPFNFHGATGDAYEQLMGVATDCGFVCMSACASSSQPVWTTREKGPPLIAKEGPNWPEIAHSKWVPKDHSFLDKIEKAKELVQRFEQCTHDSERERCISELFGPTFVDGFDGDNGFDFATAMATVLAPDRYWKCDKGLTQRSLTGGARITTEGLMSFVTDAVLSDETDLWDAERQLLARPTRNVLCQGNKFYAFPFDGGDYFDGKPPSRTNDASSRFRFLTQVALSEILVISIIEPEDEEDDSDDTDEGEGFPKSAPARSGACPVKRTRTPSLKGKEYFKVKAANKKQKSGVGGGGMP